MGVCGRNNMEITNSFIDSILRNMGVDVDCKDPPHWIPIYFDDKCEETERLIYQYMCSRCGKVSHTDAKPCDCWEMIK